MKRYFGIFNADETKSGPCSDIQWKKTGLLKIPKDAVGKCYQKSAGWARVTCHRARQMIRAQISQEEK